MDLNRLYTWEMPVRLVFGPGCSRSAGEELRKLGGTKALLATDRGVVGAGVLASVLESLAEAGLAHAIFDGVEPNPSIRCVEAATALYRDEACDCLLGIGGGSSMDVAKAVGAIVAHPKLEIQAMEGVGKVTNQIPPLVVVPTTCGTGSDATLTAVVTDTGRHYKMPIMSSALYPRVALIDGNLLTRLPGPVVASTGMDAFCHALESYTNLNTNPISDALDLQAIGMISKWLRPAAANGNLEALSHMVLAATIAGMGFANTRVTIVHAMSHPVSAFYGVPHGVANAVLLPYAMEFNLIGNAERFGDVARTMGEDTLGLTPMEAARLSIKAVRELNHDVGIPESLKPYGVDERHLAEMVEYTFKSGNVPLNPVRITREQVADLYWRAMR